MGSIMMADGRIVSDDSKAAEGLFGEPDRLPPMPTITREAHDDLHARCQRAASRLDNGNSLTQAEKQQLAHDLRLLMMRDRR